MTGRPRLEWQPVLRESGGAILALATDGRAVLAGTASGAFFAETGAPWSALTFPPSWGRPELANPVALAPWGDRYIATPNGLFRQQPNGRWHRCLEGGAIVAIATAVDASRRLVVVADQLDGILVSQNAGTEWELANAGLPTLVDIVDLVLSPHFAQDRTALLVAADGVFLSRARRWNWHEVEPVPGQPEAGAIVARDDARLVLVVASDEGLFRSRDRGRTWEPLSAVPDESCEALATDPSGRFLVAAFGRTVVLTRDGGDTWERLPDLPSHVLNLALPEPSSPIAGTLSLGCFRWNPPAATWEAWSDGLYGRLPIGLIVRPPRGIVLADYSGTVLRSDDGGESWQRTALDRGLAQFTGGTSGPLFALALDGILRSPDALGWELVYPIEDLSESTWLLGSDDGRVVCLVEHEVQEPLESSATLHLSTNSGTSWETAERRDLVLVQGAALSPDGQTLALLGIGADDLRHVLAVLSRPSGRWQRHPWPVALPETSTIRLLWSTSQDALLAVADEVVWLVHQPSTRPRIARVGQLDGPASALGRAGALGWLLATGTQVWHCDLRGTLRQLEPTIAEHTIVAVAGDPSAPTLAGYAADVGGSLWRFVVTDERA
ncbi:MAG: hypothetical protein N2Z82_02950 [Thermomicrobium sp.]|nr:hypothetical protein [Thermomicrobium sp.]